MNIKLLLIGVIALSITQCNSRPLMRMPDFPIELLDSSKSTSYKLLSNVSTPIILMYFSPDCESCQAETREILQHIKEFKNSTLMLITFDPLDRLQVYRDYYKLSKNSNIILGRDFQYVLAKSLSVNTTPYLAIFNKRKNLTTSFAGKPNIDILLERLKKSI